MSIIPKEFPKLSSSQESQLIHELTHYALSQGLLIYPPSPFKQNQPILAPVTLYPTPFPKAEFEKAVQISTKYNELYANIVIEKKWLTSIISELSEFDKDFTGKLYQTYLTAVKIGIAQNVSLALIRSDYMLDTKTNSIKQIEFNTVSVSFGGLSSKVGDLHKYLNDSGNYSTNDESKYYDSIIELPVSESASLLAKGLYHGVSYYQSHHTHKNQQTIVLFVIQPDERNAFDQRCVEFALFQNYGIKSKRIELPNVSKVVKVDDITKKLYFQNDEVSVVYYRSAYGPAEFEIQEAWDARLLLETTLSIKCPSLLTQLSGSKKIQQLLTDDKIIDRFLPFKSKINEKLKSTFVKIYPMENEHAIKLAFENPEKFVLKPQREGGGNNIYKQDIPNFLNSIPKSEWAGYILMELINPPIFDNPILKSNDVVKEGLVSELGIFGSYLFNEFNGEILNNDYSGHLLRSKTQSSNEGGVAAGFGCVDSLYLY